jgi:PEP-CTERM motif
MTKSMQRIAIALAVASAPLVAAPAAAATLLVNGSGQLTGATGVDVGGTLYDVTFVDGTCASVFGGCDSSSDFQFTTQAAAAAASQALIDQVFLDGPDGNFDTNYELTVGCGANIYGYCAALVPYTIGPVPPNETYFYAHEAANFGGAGDGVYGPFSGSTTTFDTTDGPYSGGGGVYVWAVFTPSVPEPSTWAMMLLGFGVIGGALRYGRRSAQLGCTHHNKSRWTC